MTQSSDSQADLDRFYMWRAMVLARNGVCSVAPNPPVGAVVVRDGEIVGEGFHVRAGEAHAEAIAIAKAGTHARGATLYVTLEPCNHFGRTPPCAELVIERGIARVVIAMRDPNPRVPGKGMERLVEHGIDVTVGCLEEKAKSLSDPWLTSLLTEKGRAFLYAIASLDGYRCGRKAIESLNAGGAIVRLLRRAAAYEGAMVIVDPDVPLESGGGVPEHLGTPKWLGAVRKCSEPEFLNRVSSAGSVAAALTALSCHSVMAPAESVVGASVRAAGTEMSVLFVHLPVLLGSGVIVGGEFAAPHSFRLERVGRLGGLAWSLYKAL